MLTRMARDIPSRNWNIVAKYIPWRKFRNIIALAINISHKSEFRLIATNVLLGTNCQYS